MASNGDSRANKEVDIESCNNISTGHTTIQKAPHRGKQIRKYMVLFSVILLFVVTSITFALVLTTKNIVDEIPTKAGQQVKGSPALESMEVSLHNLSKSQDNLVQVSDISLWKTAVQKMYSMIHSMVCIKSCIDRPDGDCQSCSTCGGFISCSGGIAFNMSCMLSFPDRLMLWDNIKGRCGYNSITCDPSYLFDV